MSIIDRDQQRLLVSHVAAQPIQAMQARVGRVGHVERLDRGGGVEHRPGQLGRPAQPARTQLVGHAVEHRLEQLAHDPEGKARLELAAACGQHPHPALAGGAPRGRHGDRARRPAAAPDATRRARARSELGAPRGAGPHHRSRDGGRRDRPPGRRRRPRRGHARDRVGGGRGRAGVQRRDGRLRSRSPWCSWRRASRRRSP